MVCSLILLALLQPDPQALVPLYRENAVRMERVHGPGHPKARQARRDLAHYLARIGQLVEAAAILRESAESAVDFAVLADLVPPEQTTPFLKMALLKQEQESGPDHPSVAVRLNNLALTLPPREAEPLLRRALAINEKALGGSHLETAATLNNLADVLASLRRFREAEPLARRSVAIFAQTLGPDSERTQTALANLKGIQRAIGSRGSSP
jgi:tetratricopeptide (TPR) repeat protein